MTVVEATTSEALGQNTPATAHPFLNSLTKLVRSVERAAPVGCLRPVLSEVMTRSVRLSASTRDAAGFILDKLHNELGPHRGAPCFCYVLDSCVPLGVRAEPCGIRAYCLGSDAAVAGLLAINVFIGYYQYCGLQFIPGDDGTDGNRLCEL